jgi:hypothetical protein
LLLRFLHPAGQKRRAGNVEGDTARLSWSRHRSFEGRPVQQQSEPAEPPQRYAQRRRWLKTSFVFNRKTLDYSVESRNDSAVRRKISWESIASRPSYFTTVEPDRELRWVAFVVSILAVVATLRGGPQPLTGLLYIGTAAVFFLGVWLTAGLRRVAFTALPAQGASILVLQDKQHDAIVGAIERERAQSLMKAAEPTQGMTVRLYLQRLRWLVNAGVLSPGEFAQRQKLALPGTHRPLLAPQPALEPDRTFRQRKLGETVTVTLAPDRLEYSRSTLFGGGETVGIPYRNLGEPQSFSVTSHQHELTALIFSWLAIVAMAWAGWISQGHPADHYVGGQGLRNALGDFGPPLLFMVIAAAAVPRLIWLRHATPYPRITLLEDRQYGEMLAAIEQRRIAAMRQLCEPDPLLTVEEQIEILDGLHADGIISGDEHHRSVQHARFACNNPALDKPVASARDQRRVLALH